MPRRNGNKKFNTKRNRGSHQRRRTTRGHRKISKFKKYRWYESVEKESNTMAKSLPTTIIKGEQYFIDHRLGELRNVNNPHDRKEITVWGDPFEWACDECLPILIGGKPGKLCDHCKAHLHRITNEMVDYLHKNKEGLRKAFFGC